MGALTRGRVSAEIHVLRHNGRLLREKYVHFKPIPAARQDSARISGK